MCKFRDYGCQGLYGMIFVVIGIIWAAAKIIQFTAIQLGDSNTWQVRMFGAILVVIMVVITAIGIYKIFCKESD